MSAKTDRITIKCTPEFREQWEESCNQVGISSSDLSRASLEATMQYIKAEGMITLPFRIVETVSAIAGRKNFSQESTDAVFKLLGSEAFLAFAEAQKKDARKSSKSASKKKPAKKKSQ